LVLVQTCCLDFQHDDKQHNDSQHDDKQHNDTQHDDKQHYDTQHDDKQHYDTQHDVKQLNDTQQDDKQDNDTQHYDKQHNDTQQNSKMLSNVMLCVGYAEYHGFLIVMLTVVGSFKKGREDMAVNCTEPPSTSNSGPWIQDFSA
jgi:hypothetical protein